MVLNVKVIYGRVSYNLGALYNYTVSDNMRSCSLLKVTRLSL